MGNEDTEDAWLGPASRGMTDAVEALRILDTGNNNGSLG